MNQLIGIQKGGLGKSEKIPGKFQWNLHGKQQMVTSKMFP